MGYVEYPDMQACEEIAACTTATVAVPPLRGSSSAQPQPSHHTPAQSRYKDVDFHVYSADPSTPSKPGSQTSCTHIDFCAVEGFWHIVEKVGGKRKMSACTPPYSELYRRLDEHLVL